jgi:hypothetical protein
VCWLFLVYSIPQFQVVCMVLEFTFGISAVLVSFFFKIFLISLLEFRNHLVYVWIRKIVFA